MTNEQLKRIKFLFSKEVQAKDQRIYFRDLFRDARAKALNNAENFEDLIFAIEKLGKFLRGETKENGDLGKYKPYICNIAEKSVLAEKIPKELPEFHIDFSSLYELLRNGRNSAMHEGVFARNLTQHAIEISLILENALMCNEMKVKDFMIRNPICAYDWQPISFIRQNMLSNSFSYLPIFHDNQWKLISDLAISKYLQGTSNNERKKRLSRTFKDSEIEPLQTKIVDALDEISQIIKNWNGYPICVTLKNSSEELVGILTPFDLL